MQKQISNFVLQLQSQKRLPLWALANEVVIYAAAINEKPTFGPRTRRLHRLMRIAYKLKMSDMLIFGVGLGRAFSTWRACKKKSMSDEDLGRYHRIFVGSSVSSEQYLHADYVKQSILPLLKLNNNTFEGVSAFGKPRLKDVFMMLVRQAIGFTAKLKSAESEINGNTIDFLTTCAANIGSYAFYRIYWRKVKAYNIEEVAFIALDVPVFACIDEGIKTVYLQHGLLARTVLIPRLDHMYTLTDDEESYFKEKFKGFKVTRVRKPGERLRQIKQDVIMLLSPDFMLEESVSIIKKLLKQTMCKSLKVVIRPRPRVTPEDLEVLLQAFPNTVMDDLSISLSASIEKWNPKVIAANCITTGLATALDYACLPVCFFNPDIESVWVKEIYPHNWWNVIYPMRSRTLFWPRDDKLIAEAIVSQSAYEAQLEALRKPIDEKF
jgi:hypothetical protein